MTEAYSIRAGWPGILAFNCIISRNDTGATLTITVNILKLALHFGISAIS